VRERERGEEGERGLTGERDDPPSSRWDLHMKK
jgi:hypothetical protein